MADTVKNLILDLIEWVARQERTCHRTCCPRLPVWEDATGRGLVETTLADGRSLVQVTPTGFASLKQKRADCYELIRRVASGEATKQGVELKR